MIGPFAALNWFDIPLFALDIEEVFPVVIFVIITIIIGIAQFINKQKEEAARQRRLEAQARRRAELAEMEQREQDARPPQRQRPFSERPKPAAAPVDDEVAAELRDFLERAATDRAPTSPKPTPPVVAAQVEPAEEKHVPLANRPTRHSSLERRSVPTSHPVEADVIIKPPTTQERRQAEAIRAKKQVAAAAQARSSKKQKGLSKFDHQVGSLGQRPQAEKAGQALTLTPAAMANDIAVMFAGTENIRQAIVISEILTRPVHRWE